MLSRFVPNPLPATFLRGGTSKGVYINASHLSHARETWDPIFLRIMGSPDPQYGRQLDGMGGGVSSLSKICVVGAASESPALAAKYPGVDIQYTFAQVGIRDDVVDYSGNCGNLSSMVGVFALDEGICKPRVLSSVPKRVGAGSEGTEEFSIATVRALNTNTDKLIDTTFPVRLDSAGNWIPVLNLAQAAIAGVPGKTSQITLDFVYPGGARTGKLLPTGNPVDTVSIQSHGQQLHVRLSLVDATNPTVFLSAEDLQPLVLHGDGSLDYAHPQVTSALEQIRQKGAALMGLDPTAQAQPKIAVLSRSRTDASSPPDTSDIVIHALSMGVLHKAVPMTVGLCLGVAAGIRDTLAWEIVDKARRFRGREDGGTIIQMEHPSGIVQVGADFDETGNPLNAKVIRTGRRLMKGVVWW